MGLGSIWLLFSPALWAVSKITNVGGINRRRYANALFCVGAGVLGAIFCPLASRQEDYYTKSTMLWSFFGWTIIAVVDLILWFAIVPH